MNYIHEKNFNQFTNRNNHPLVFWSKNFSQYDSRKIRRFVLFKNKYIVLATLMVTFSFGMVFGSVPKAHAGYYSVPPGSMSSYVEDSFGKNNSNGDINGYEQNFTLPSTQTFTKFELTNGIKRISTCTTNLEFVLEEGSVTNPDTGSVKAHVFITSSTISQNEFSHISFSFSSVTLTPDIYHWYIQAPEGTNNCYTIRETSNQDSSAQIYKLTRNSPNPTAVTPYSSGTISFFLSSDEFFLFGSTTLNTATSTIFPPAPICGSAYATSTIWDDIVCSGRKVAYYAVFPVDSGPINFFNTAIGTFTGVFPFNIFFNTAGTIQNEITNTSGSPALTITGYGGFLPNGFVVLSSSSLTGLIGASAKNSYFDFLTNLTWAVVGFFIIKTIIS